MVTNTRQLSPLLFLGLAACMSDAAEGLAPAKPAKTHVRFDLYTKPLPTIPLPNDYATRYDGASATKRRINASMVAPTKLEGRVRQLIDQVDGWGVFQPISVPFDGPIDIASITAGHRDRNYDPTNDVIYLVNVDKKSKNFGRLYHLDVGNGNYPVVLEKSEYWKNDPRGWLLSLLYEEENEDKNGNGTLDAGEDTDADGILDVPNYLPGMNPAREDLAGRADALMTFYEKQTNTLLVRPMIPLDERTTYAVVVTRRIKDASGEPIGSPFAWVNDTSQTKALEPLKEIIDRGIEHYTSSVGRDADQTKSTCKCFGLDDIAFTFTFTTQTVESAWIAVREGLYGHGVQGHIGKEFPAELAGLERIRDEQIITGIKNPYVMYTENWISRFKEMYEDVFDANTDGEEFAALEEAHKYIDYHVIGSYTSPQLFTRADPDGKWLPYHDQVWPEDLDTKPAPARGETVHFWLTIPRKEVSPRGQGKPAPIVVLGHGYTSSRLEALPFAGYFAKHGFATLAIDCVSHGVGVSDLVIEAAKGIFKDSGLGPFVDAALKDRAVDLNGDLERDSGADFWTAYLFHTRDVVRQSAVDYMQLLRIVYSFDGQNKWKLDVNGDGVNELAGDFDADGQVDIGAESMIGMTGGSLGGIMTLVVGGLEPNVDVGVPIAGGGGLSDIGVRSQQGGVREAVSLRLMAPLYVGDIQEGKMKVETIVPDLNGWSSRHIGTVDNVKAGDTVVVENLVNGERGCAYVSGAGGTWRTAVDSDRGDLTRILFYDGDALVLGGEECETRSGVTPYATVDKFIRDFQYQGEWVNQDDPLVSLEDGFGLRRGHPDLRRMMGLAQVVLDPADPAVMARHSLKEPIKYERTGQETGTHLMVVTTVGDMNVPASSGLTLGRAAGLLEYLADDPRYGKPQNQVLIENYMAEAVHKYNRFTFSDDTSRGVHMDVENFSQGSDMWGTRIPRLDPPVRAGTQQPDPLGGTSGAIFPYPTPEGEHGFAFPGGLTDTAIKACQRGEMPNMDPQQCSTLKGSTFDVGFFMFNTLGKYFKAAGKTVDFQLCNSSNDCSEFAPTPEARDVNQLR